MGSTKDPADGKAVAGSVFAAVVVYAVGYIFLEIEGVGTFLFDRFWKRSWSVGMREGLTCWASRRSFSFSAVSRHFYMFGRVRRGL